MAKILLGPTVIGIRGTVAGITFSNNKGGPYARGWHTPPNPRTQNQLTRRSTLAQWAVAWRGLSAANQAQWVTYAAAAPQALTDSLGQTYYASGFNWFVNVNMYRQYMGLAQLSTAPTIAAPAAPSVQALTFRVTGNPLFTAVKLNVGAPTLALYHVVNANIVNSLGVNVGPVKKYFMRCAIPDVNRNIIFATQQATKFGTTTVAQRLFTETFALSTEGRYGASTFSQANGILVG